MKVSQIKEKLNLEYVVQSDNEAVSGYASDLLSVVMGKVKPQSVWLTVQTHKNIVAVAKMADISAIVICDGFSPDDDTVEAAQKENIPILKTDKGVFEIAGMLYESGIR
ncbi:MAG: DRTGG domain-containing protein [bacterium]|nr:DRTGG domain-containing protein [bacterium]